MYDPNTIAHEIRLFGHRLITVWHVDPELDGSDDSCGWFCPTLNQEECDYAEALITDEFDNIRRWFQTSDDQEAIDHVRRIFQLHKRLLRPWWRHPRWHFWHWRFQVHPVQHFKRWAFSRCTECGGRFRWGEAPLSLGWGGRGPRWFRSERQILHNRCYSAWQQKKWGQ